MASLNACAELVNSVHMISCVWRVRHAPCSNSEAAVVGNVGLWAASAGDKLDGPSGTGVDATGVVGLVLNRPVHVEV
jgi:hypothetical protein